MQIIKDRQIVESHWHYCAPDEHPEAIVPDGAQIEAEDSNHSLLPYSTWLELDPGAQAKVRGISILPEDDLTPVVEMRAEKGAEKIAGRHSSLEIIAIVFPTFNEGRGYSQARIVRHQLHFGGELRAINAYRDNLLLLEECGFNAFELTPTEDIAQAISAFDELQIARH